MSLPTSLGSPDLEAPRRYCVWCYSNDWDGWRLQWSSDDREEVIDYVATLESLKDPMAKRLGHDLPVFGGILLTDTITARIQPTPDLSGELSAHVDSKLSSA